MKKDIFLPLDVQLENFIKYNEWLNKNHSQLLISKEEIVGFKNQIKDINSKDPLLVFYCHKSDVVLSAKLAWEWVVSYRKTWKSSYVRFESAFMKPADNEPRRPTGFFIKKLPEEDKEGIGKKFQGKSVADARKNLKGDWGMGFEGIQVLGITLPHYPELMDGGKVPFIDLPGLAIVPFGDGGFYYAPYLYFYGGELRLYYGHVDGADSDCGSGSLQQCQ